MSDRLKVLLLAVVAVAVAIGTSSYLTQARALHTEVTAEESAAACDHKAAAVQASTDAASCPYTAAAATAEKSGCDDSAAAVHTASAKAGSSLKSCERIFNATVRSSRVWRAL